MDFKSIFCHYPLYICNFKNILLANGSERDIPPKKKVYPVLFPASTNSYISFFLFCPHKEKRYLCVTVRQPAKRKKGWRRDEITVKGAVMYFSLQKVFSHFIYFLIVIKKNNIKYHLNHYDVYCSVVLSICTVCNRSPEFTYLAKKNCIPIEQLLLYSYF